MRYLISFQKTMADNNKETKPFFSKISKKERERRRLAMRASEELKKINYYHVRIFPEEYDFIYDDTFDEQMRKEGTNPMKESYQLEVNKRRRKIGVVPFSQLKEAPSYNSTYKWVAEKIKNGDEKQLITIIELFFPDEKPY